MLMLDFWRAALGFCLTPLYISSSKTSAKTTTLTSTSTENTDKRQVVSDQGIGVSADNSSVMVNVLDGGAIAGSLALARQTDLTSAANFRAALGFADETYDRASNVLDKSLSLVDKTGVALTNAFDKSNALVASAFSEAKGEATQKNILTAVALVAVGVVAVTQLKR
jgi:hypothetical protein